MSKCQDVGEVDSILVTSGAEIRASEAVDPLPS